MPDEFESMPELVVDETDDWIQYVFDTYGATSPEYQAVRIKDGN